MNTDGWKFQESRGTSTFSTSALRFSRVLYWNFPSSLMGLDYTDYYTDSTLIMTRTLAMEYSVLKLLCTLCATFVVVYTRCTLYRK